MVVYVNGQEIGRQDMPAGQVAPLTEAGSYPVEAFLQDGDKGPLPTSGDGALAPERYALRIRKASFVVPPAVLRVQLWDVGVDGGRDGRPATLPVALMKDGKTSAGEMPNFCVPGTTRLTRSTVGSPLLRRRAEGGWRVRSES